MSFSQYAKLLYRVLGGKKWAFTAELLRAGLPGGCPLVDKLTKDRSGKDRLRKYLSGERGIDEIALDIQAGYDHFTFVDYIEETYSEYYAALVKAFAAKGIVIEPGDEAAQLTELFESIFHIGDYAQKSDGDRNPTAIAAQSSESKQFAKLLEKLTDQFDKVSASLLKLQTEYSVAAPRKEKKQKDTIKKDLHSFKVLNEMLKEYIFCYPDFTALDQLYDLGGILMALTSLPVNSKSDAIEQALKKYRELLIEVSKLYPQYLNPSQS
jgi:hypothetical protein